MNQARDGNDAPAGRAATQRFVACKDQASCRLGSESVVLDLKQGKYFGLNDVAARVFELLAQPHSLDELVATITREYEVDPARCASDLRQLLAELERLGVIEACREPAA